MHVELSVQMDSHERPSNIPAFQIEEFDPTKFNDTEVKQAQGAINCIKVIHTCLKAYFDGHVHMYKPISSQLRILFCDTQRKKDHSLINRIHPTIKLLAFRELKFESQGGPISMATAPYMITEYPNGLVDAKLDVAFPYRYIALSDWRNQLVELQPTMSLNDIIRAVADQDGGAHLDDTDSAKLTIMKRHNPTKVGSNVLFIIALAHYAIDLANELAPIWIKNGKISV